MDKYELIELSKYSGSKNIICHLLAPKLAICLTKVECARSYIVAIDDGIRYCLTGNARIFDQDSEYVILTDHTPTVQKLLDGSVRQKKWIHSGFLSKNRRLIFVNQWFSFCNPESYFEVIGSYDREGVCN